MTFDIRPAKEADLPELIRFEIDIATESFGDEALVEPDQHRGRLEKALVRDPEGCLVATDSSDRPIGWCWMTINSNFLTGASYASFRSLAVDSGPHQTTVARALVRSGLEYAWSRDVTEVIGKVSAANLRMRTLYRELGFEPRHLTMRLRKSDG